MDPTSRDQLFVRNPHLKELEDDVLFHIGITAGDHKNLKNLFGDVKVISMLQKKKSIISTVVC